MLGVSNGSAGAIDGAEQTMGFAYDTNNYIITVKNRNIKYLKN